jgi:hypothetical protein
LVNVVFILAGTRNTIPGGLSKVLSPPLPDPACQGSILRLTTTDDCGVKPAQFFRVVTPPLP